jgi:hypothetical protein
MHVTLADNAPNCPQPFAQMHLPLRPPAAFIASAQERPGGHREGSGAHPKVQGVHSVGPGERCSGHTRVGSKPLVHVAVEPRRSRDHAAREHLAHELDHDRVLDPPAPGLAARGAAPPIRSMHGPTSRNAASTRSAAEGIVARRWSTQRMKAGRMFDQYRSTVFLVCVVMPGLLASCTIADGTDGDDSAELADHVRVHPDSVVRANQCGVGYLLSQSTSILFVAQSGLRADISATAVIDGTISGITSIDFAVSAEVDPTRSPTTRMCRFNSRGRPLGAAHLGRRSLYGGLGTPRPASTSPGPDRQASAGRAGMGRLDPACHPDDQEPHSFGAHRTMVALPVIDLGPATSTPTLGYASHSRPASFRHTTRSATPKLSPLVDAPPGRSLPRQEGVPGAASWTLGAHRGGPDACPIVAVDTAGHGAQTAAPAGDVAAGVLIARITHRQQPQPAGRARGVGAGDPIACHRRTADRG